MFVTLCLDARPATRGKRGVSAGPHDSGTKAGGTDLEPGLWRAVRRWRGIPRKGAGVFFTASAASTGRVNLSPKGDGLPTGLFDEED